jgi:hypothetical protein
MGENVSYPSGLRMVAQVPVSQGKKEDKTNDKKMMKEKTSILSQKV